MGRLVVLLLLIPLVALAADVSTTGFCNNFRQITLIDFPYSSSGTYTYFVDSSNTYGFVEYLTQPNTTLVVPYNGGSFTITDQNGNAIVPPVSLPDCGTDFGTFSVDMSGYCNTNNYATYVDSTILTSLGPSYSYYYVAVFFDPNHQVTDWNYLFYEYTEDTVPLYIYQYSQYMQFQLFVYIPAVGFGLPLASKTFTSVSNCSESSFQVDTSTYCDHFKMVRVFLDPFQQADYSTADLPFTWGVYNSMNVSRWVDVELQYASNSSWNFTVYGRFGFIQSQVISLPTCSGEYGPISYDTTGYCGNGWLMTIFNNYYTNDSINFYDEYVYIERASDQENQNSLYVYPGSSSTVAVIPGKYDLITQSYRYIYESSYQTLDYQITTSFRNLDLTCPTQYGGGVSIDTSNYCTNGYVQVTIPTNQSVQIALNFPGAYEYGSTSITFFNYYNYYNPPQTVTAYFGYPGYYTALRGNIFTGTGYPTARSDFVLPVCTTQNTAPVTVDLTNYCTNFRRYTLSVPNGVVSFFYAASDLTTVLGIYYGQNTWNLDAPIIGQYSFISFTDNVPNLANIISRTDVDFYDCGEEFGPARPVIDTTGYCDNFRTVIFSFPGQPNDQYLVYYRNDTSAQIGYTDYTTGQIALQAGQYELIHGTIDNPQARFYFTITATCPTEFGNFTIDSFGYCNNHKKWSILVPYSHYYFFYQNYDPVVAPNYYYTIVYNYDCCPSGPEYKTFQLGDVTVSNFTVVSWNNNYPGDPTPGANFVTSRKSFELTTPPTCPILFGPEYIIQTCDFTGGVVTIAGVIGDSYYYLFSVVTPYDDLTNANALNSYYVSPGDTQLRISLPTPGFYSLASKYNNDITSNLFIDGTAANTNLTNSQFYFPPSVLQGDVAYAEVSLSGIPAFCLSARTLCKFGSVVIEAVAELNMLRCQVPLLPVGTYSVSFSTDDGATFETSCRTIQIVQDPAVVAFDYSYFAFDVPSDAYMTWDRASTSGQGLNYVKIEAYQYSLLNVSANAQILVYSSVDVLFNRSLNIGYYKWDTSLYDLSFLALQISFGTSYTSYSRRSVAYVSCRWAYCGRRDFCAYYGFSQHIGDSDAALNPFDQACKSHAFCSTNTSLCPSYCDEILTSMITQTLYGSVQDNPFGLSPPVSTSYSSADLKWAQKAVISFSKAVPVVLREVPTTVPYPCPAPPTATTTITTMACGDPHYTLGNTIFDMQMPGEFIYYSGYARRASTNLMYGSTNFSIATAPTVVSIQQKEIVSNPRFISMLTGVSVVTRQAPHSSIIVSSKTDLELYHDGILIDLLQSCNYYFVGGSVEYTSSQSLTIVLDDGIQITITGGFGSICLSMTISGVFVNTGGFWGGVSQVGNQLHGKCNNGTTLTVIQGVLANENLALGRCWKLSGNDNLFDVYNLSLPVSRRSQDENTVSEPKRRLDIGKRDPACDAIPNELLADMCNADLPYLPEVNASDIAAVSASTAQTYNLATGVNLGVTLEIDDEDVVMTLNVSLENWDLNANPLDLSVQTRYASSSDLSSFTNWEDFFVNPQNYSADPIVTDILFTPAANCTTYAVRAQVTSVNSNFSSPWISASVGSNGSCFSVILQNQAIIVSNDLPSPANFTDIAPTDPEPVTTGAITVGFEFTTSPLTSGPVTSRQLTTRPVTTRPITTGIDVTTGAITSAAVTSAAVTSAPVTSAAVTSQALTTDFISVASRCASYSFASVQGYFCSADHTGYYQCLSGPFASQSAFRPCAPGTRCRCATGVECSQYGVCTF